MFVELVQQLGVLVAACFETPSLLTYQQESCASFDRFGRTSNGVEGR